MPREFRSLCTEVHYPIRQRTLEVCGLNDGFGSLQPFSLSGRRLIE